MVDVAIVVYIFIIVVFVVVLFWLCDVTIIVLDWDAIMEVFVVVDMPSVGVVPVFIVDTWLVVSKDPSSISKCWKIGPSWSLNPCSNDFFTMVGLIVNGRAIELCFCTTFTLKLQTMLPFLWRLHEWQSGSPLNTVGETGFREQSVHCSNVNQLDTRDQGRFYIYLNLNLYVTKWHWCHANGSQK